MSLGFGFECLFCFEGGVVVDRSGVGVVIVVFSFVYF